MNSDLVLLELICKQDQHALEELYDKHVPLLYQMLWEKSLSQTFIEGIIHDIFLFIWKNPLLLIEEKSVGVFIIKSGLEKAKQFEKVSV